MPFLRTVPLLTSAPVPLLLLLGCKADASPDAAGSGVLAALASYDTLILRMDPARISAAFLADGETTDGDQAPIGGPAAIREHLLSFSAFHVLANHLQADTTRILADTAWQTGTYWQRVRVPQGDTIEVHGRFEVTWFQTAPGHWQIHRMHTFRPPST